jgi:hypothetical protein
VLEPRGNSLEDRDRVVLRVVVAAVNPREQSREDDEEGGPEGSGEEGSTLDGRRLGLTLDVCEEELGAEEESETEKTKCGVLGGVGEMFEPERTPSEEGGREEERGKEGEREEVERERMSALTAKLEKRKSAHELMMTL